MKIRYFFKISFDNEILIDIIELIEIVYKLDFFHHQKKQKILI
jgi:hypothetical protein